MCVCQNEGLIGTLCACCETCQTIFAPESLKSVIVQKVSQTDRMVLVGPRRIKQGLTRLAPKSWKSASLQKVLQTDALA